MGKVLWHTVMSLDGFVAGPGDDMRWAFEVEAGSDETIDDVVASTGALLVGRRTQDIEDREQPGFYGGSYRGPFFVLRHDPPSQPPVVKGVTGRFIDLPIDDAVALAQAAAGDKDVVILGANVAQQCLRPACSTRCSSTSHQSCWATGSACSTSQKTLRFGSTGRQSTRAGS